MGFDILELLQRCERICKMRGLSADDGPDDFRGLMVDLASAIEHFAAIGTGAQGGGEWLISS